MVWNLIVSQFPTLIPSSSTSNPDISHTPNPQLASILLDRSHLRPNILLLLDEGSLYGIVLCLRNWLRGSCLGNKFNGIRRRACLEWAGIRWLFAGSSM